REKPSIHLVQRYITRPLSETENNISLTPTEFKKMEKADQFALKWNIYGLYYGVSIEIDEWLKSGDLVLVNVSRTIVKNVRRIYKNVKVVFIQVPLEVSVERLKRRARENQKLLDERIERARKNQTFPTANFIVDNSGPLDNAIKQFLEYLLETVNNSNTI
ncbi:MAG: hypothetical protein ACFE9R_13665, partial [Candidatus Hermodarchaeota archaeon]